MQQVMTYIMSGSVRPLCNSSSTTDNNASYVTYVAHAQQHGRIRSVSLMAVVKPCNMTQQDFWLPFISIERRPPTNRTHTLFAPVILTLTADLMTLLYKVAATAFDCIRGTGSVGHTSVLLNDATCWFLAPELSSADGVFQLLHRPSGTLFRHTCARHSSLCRCLLLILWEHTL